MSHQQPPDNPFHFAIAATFTAEPIEPVLRFWGEQLGEPFEVSFAPIGQLVQTLLGPSSVFARNRRGVNVLLVRASDLASFDGAEEDTAARIESNAALLASAIEQARLAVPLIVSVCPSTVPNELEKLLQRAIVLPASEIDRLYPVADRDSPQGDKLGGIPYTEAYFAALGTALVRLAHALTAPPYKVIALDCDNTLWSGVCGEDGPAGVAIDPPHRYLQEFMLKQREAGMLLAVVSKNNEQDVLDTFAHHAPPLGPGRLAARRINWQPKEINLAEIASELSLGLDSFILVDDSAKECAEVSEAEPEVLTLALPADPARIPAFLDHVWAFDHAVTTEADRKRTEAYEQGRAFDHAARASSSLEHFYDTLQLDVRIGLLAPGDAARAAQLTLRTNQFNCTTIRRTEAQIAALSGHDVHAIFVSDRFGDYGLTGLLITRTGDLAIEVDTFLLSCRVLGRGVEHRVMRWLGGRGLGVEVRLEPTPRNAPAAEFLESIASPWAVTDGHARVYRIPVAALASIEFRIPTEPIDRVRHEAPSRPEGGRSVDYARIARQLATVDEILAAMRKPAQLAPELDLTETEQALARIWHDVLKRTPASPDNNFFDLGGHSLLAVLLAVQVKDILGVELSMDDIYRSDLTLRTLARVIDTRRAGGDDYDALLAEIESLSDEEVRELLAREEGREAAG